MSALLPLVGGVLQQATATPTPTPTPVPPPGGPVGVALTDRLLRDLLRIVGLALASGVLATVVGLVYRWLTRERIPTGVAVLAGLGVVAIILNSTAALQQVIGGDEALLSVRAAVANTIAFLLAGAAAGVGGRVGDRMGTDVFAFAGVRELDADVSQFVRTVGRVTTVTLPEAGEIEDVDNYDPVAPETKEALAGKTLVFPRRLTVEELRERLAERIRTEHGVGYVDVDVTAEGEIEYVALGSRVAGIGPTLAPGSAAVAVRADPALAASPGDVVQVWRRVEASEPADGAVDGTLADGAPRHERVTTAEVRATAGDVVTLAVDASEADLLPPDESYRLVTLPREARADREFASLLRAAEETMGVVTVAAGAPLAGTPIGALDVPVVAIRPERGTVEPLPGRSRLLEAGDAVYVIARPDALRRLEAGAAAVGATDGGDAG